ncbi:aminoglycoside N(3)-acetyltransferase [Sutcliffiella cohnii]
MSEAKVMEELKSPNTRTSLRRDLEMLGLKKGMVVIIHSSLSSLGWVCGGAVAVVQALMDVVGEGGTIVMPTQTGDNSDPSGWQNPPVPEEWWTTIRNEMPAFDPDITPTRGMGKIVETFRTFPNVKRSSHPMYSFAAWGKHAEYIISEQPLDAGFGEQSPLGKIYELNGYVLLMGVGHDSNTSLHLAEHAKPHPTIVEKGTAMLVNGERKWVNYKEIEYDADVFEAIGSVYEKNHSFSQYTVGKSSCKLLNQREIVDFARRWFQEN